VGSQLAEIGLSIEHAQYHKHSAYVLSNADMPGFSRMEQARLARVVLAHRGKLSKVQDAGLEGADWKLVFALRTASLILRSRTDLKLPFLRVAADAGGFAIDLPQSWLDENPLSAAASSRRRLLESNRHELIVSGPFRQESVGITAGQVTRRRALRPGPLRRAPVRQHHRPPFLIDQEACAPATRCAATRPRSGWWPTMITAPL